MRYIIIGTIYSEKREGDFVATGGDTLAEDILGKTEFKCLKQAQKVFNTIPDKFNSLSRFENDDAFALFELWDDDYIIDEIKIERGI